MHPFVGYRKMQILKQTYWVVCFLRSSILTTRNIFHFILPKMVFFLSNRESSLHFFNFSTSRYFYRFFHLFFFYAAVDKCFNNFFKMLKLVFLINPSRNFFHWTNKQTITRPLILWCDLYEKFLSKKSLQVYQIAHVGTSLYMANFWLQIWNSEALFEKLTCLIKENLEEAGNFP